MNTNILILCCISLAISLLYIKKQSSLLQSATEHLKTIPTSIKLVDDSEPPTYRTVRKKNYITINGDTNVVTYDFKKTLKDVKNIELISATIPRSQYRINEENENIIVTLNGNTYAPTLTNGVYNNITEVLLEINRQLYINAIVPEFGTNAPSSTSTNKYLNVVVDNMNKHSLFFSNNISGAITFDFSQSKKTCRKILGIDDNVSQITVNGTTDRIWEYIQSCYEFITDQYFDGTIVNNLISSYYDNLYMFPETYSDYFSSWNFYESTNRVNIAQQLYLDIEIDNITYWDGNNILQRIYIDESIPVTIYDRNYSTYRTLSENYLKLDKITLRMYSIRDEDKNIKIPYEFNGLEYSLQLEVITKNKELII